MGKKNQDDTLSMIEQAQAELRECIEKSKRLAEESERRVRRHRTEIVQDKPPNPPT